MNPANRRKTILLMSSRTRKVNLCKIGFKICFSNCFLTVLRDRSLFTGSTVLDETCHIFSIFLKSRRLNLCGSISYPCVTYAPINSKVQHPPPPGHPPRATPWAFELLKIGLFKFPPLSAKKPFKCPTN